MAYKRFLFFFFLFWGGGTGKQKKPEHVYWGWQNTVRRLHDIAVEGNKSPSRCCWCVGDNTPAGSCQRSWSPWWWFIAPLRDVGYKKDSAAVAIYQSCAMRRTYGVWSIQTTLPTRLRKIWYICQMKNCFTAAQRETETERESSVRIKFLRLRR